jgi:hypothetical protein
MNTRPNIQRFSTVPSLELVAGELAYSSTVLASMQPANGHETGNGVTPHISEIHLIGSV